MNDSAMSTDDFVKAFKDWFERAIRMRLRDQGLDDDVPLHILHISEATRHEP